MVHRQTTRKNRRSSLPGLLILILLVTGGFILWLGVPWVAEQVFGSASPALTAGQRWSYSGQILLQKDKLTNPECPISKTDQFSIQSGDSIFEIANHLQEAGLIRDAGSFRDYLIYKGLDTQIRADTYQLDCSLPAIEIANEIRNKFLTQVKFNILPGWRAEEIAAALPTSGINVQPEDFLAVVEHPQGIHLPDYIPEGASLEGFLYPGEYLIERDINARQLVQIFVDQFSAVMTTSLQKQIKKQGLTVYQGVILASIVQRETYADSERPMIASVFYNRLNAGMNLETDPTVQYALGFSEQFGWWKSPLSNSDLQVNSAYNTYLVSGLPPAPIANPDLSALEAVANPAKSDYIYFRAACDNSGTHVFARTFEEHVANQCK